MKPKEKPALRGRFHEWAAYLTLILTIRSVVLHWGQEQTQTASLIYHLSLLFLFSVSAIYHVPHWNPIQRKWLRKIDHCAIYALISGTLLPIVLVSLSGNAQKWGIITSILIFTLGSAKSLIWAHSPKVLSAILYVLLSFGCAPFLPELSKAISFEAAMGFTIGGFIYILGAIIYALKRPNPNPRTFGYHEIFHILVVVAAAIHYILLDSILSQKIN